MELQGIVHKILETQVVTDKFQKREFVIQTDEQYPQSILMELQQERCDIIDFYKVGQSVKCLFVLKGREWVNKQGESKYFNTFVCLGIQP